MRPTRAIQVLAGIAVLGCLGASTPLDRPLGGPAPAIAGVAASPPLGWNSWNAYGCNIDESRIEAAADAMVSTGMRDAGYRYVIVDDCWFDPERAADGQLQADPVRFPHGMKALADYVHARGLKFGIYSTPGDRTCAQRSGAYPGSTGSGGHEATDAATFASWGVDYLKYDWCSGDSSSTHQVDAFTTMRDRLRDTGRQIVYSINANSDVNAFPPGNVSDWSGIATMSRVTNDVSPAWRRVGGDVGDQGVRDIVDAALPLASRNRSGTWIDPDMLEIGVPGIAFSTEPGLTAAEQRTQFAMWALMSAPLIAGNDLTGMGAQTRALLTNRAILAVDQDHSGSPRLLSTTGDVQVWTRTLSDGSVALALYNRGDSAAEPGIPVAGNVAAEDLWSGRTGVDLHDVTVAPHDTLMFRLYAVIP